MYTTNVVFMDLRIMNGCRVCDFVDTTTFLKMIRLNYLTLLPHDTPQEKMSILCAGQ